MTDASSFALTTPLPALTAPAASAPAVRPTGDEAAAARTAQEFEATFLSQMLSHMWTDIPTDGMFGGGTGEEIFRSLLINEYGKIISENGGIGVAEEVKRLMLRLQEV